MVRQMCEDCGEKHAHFGEVGSTERKWYGPCAKTHGGVLLAKPKMLQLLARVPRHCSC